MGSSPAASYPSYTVVDTETTGLFPNGHDRIVEITLLQLDAAGSIRNEYTTLINPERDVGATHIHGISASHVINAPRFVDVAGDVAHRLKGNIFVAHNARFDTSFIEAEFARLGQPIPPVTPLCTMRLARKFADSLRKFKLTDCCSHFKISHKEEHSSLGDARAVAGLLTSFISLAGGSMPLCELAGLQPTTPPTWPNLPLNGKTLSRQEALTNKQKPSYLSRLIQSLPASGVQSDPRSMEYIDLLNRALEDRRITDQEGELFFDLATRWGFSASQIRGIHHGYLISLIESALKDGRITGSEKRDLADVVNLLGLDPSELDHLIQTTRPEKEEKAAAAGQSMTAGVSLAGLSVCFTGQLQSKLNGQPITRIQAEELARQAGMTIAKSITKKLNVLVVADPETLSTKAKKARDYGIRIIAEPVFWRELNVNVE